MSFFQNILNWLRGIRYSISTSTTKSYPFGQIVSGSYSNAKHDFNPTILCFGSYTKQRKDGSITNLTHGLNLHYLTQSDLQWLIQFIYITKRGGQILNPRNFYYYLKMNRPNMMKAYRTYTTVFSKFYAISPGFSNASVKSCYPIKDSRDYLISQLNQMISNAWSGGNKYQEPAPVAYNRKELQDSISYILNSKKVF